MKNKKSKGEKRKRDERSTAGEDVSLQKEEDVPVAVEEREEKSKKSKKDKKKKSSSLAPAEEIPMLNQEDANSPPSKPARKEKKKKSTPSSSAAAPEVTKDMSMVDREDPVPAEPEGPVAQAPQEAETKLVSQEDAFASIYVNRLVAEIGDDLDKVRQANDFTDRSMPMLIHALRQGASIYSVEERRRVIGKAGA